MAVSQTAIVKMRLETEDKASEPMAKAAKKTSSAWGDVKKDIAKAAIGTAIIGFAKDAMSAASDLEQAMGGVDAVFGDSADTVHEWAKDTDDAIRLPAQSFEELAATLGSVWKRSGVSMDQLGAKTKETMGLAADLAARWGTSTEDAVRAVNSALGSGEFEQMKKYNVVLTAATVATEKQRLASGEMAGATDAALTTQARYNLIMGQSADAIGTAADESDTFAAKQEALNEQWQNMLAAVGGPLISAMGPLLTVFADLVETLTPAITVLGELVGWILQLPGPLLAVVAAAAGWMGFGKKITDSITGIVTSFKDAITNAGGFKSAMGSAFRSLGTGLAIGGIVGAVGFVIDIFMQMASASKEAAQGAEDYGDAILEAGGVTTTAAKQFRESQVEQSDAFADLQEAGFLYGDAMRFLTGAMSEAEEAAFRSSDTFGTLGILARKNVEETHDMGDAALKYAADKQAYIDSENAAAAATGEATAASEESADALAKQAEEQQKAALSAAQAAAEQTHVATELARVDKEASAASRALDFFSQAMDGLAGRNVSMEQAAQGLNDALRGTAEQFKSASEAGELNTGALASWDVAALTSTESGSQLYDELSGMRSAYDDAAMAAYSNALKTGDAATAFTAAQGAATNARAAFVETAKGFLGSTEAAEALADKLGILDGTQLNPKVFSLIAEDAEAQRKVAQLQAAGIDPKNIVVTATTDEATGAVSNVVSVAEGAQPDIDVGAITGEATGAIGKVEKGSYDATVDVDADTMSAARSIAAMSSGRYTAMITVNGDTAPAANAVNNFAAAYRSSTVTVFANTQPAENSIYAITSGYYTATVQVKANVQAATSAIAAVPRTAGAPALMSSGGFIPAPYPAIHGSAQPSTVIPGPTYHITVTGAVDAESTSRQILSLIRGHERRTSGVRL